MADIKYSLEIDGKNYDIVLPANATEEELLQEISRIRATPSHQQFVAKKNAGKSSAAGKFAVRTLAGEGFHITPQEAQRIDFDVRTKGPKRALEEARQRLNLFQNVMPTVRRITEGNILMRALHTIAQVPEVVPTEILERPLRRALGRPAPEEVPGRTFVQRNIPFTRDLVTSAYRVGMVPGIAAELGVELLNPVNLALMAGASGSPASAAARQLERGLIGTQIAAGLAQIPEAYERGGTREAAVAAIVPFLPLAVARAMRPVSRTFRLKSGARGRVEASPTPPVADIAPEITDALSPFAPGTEVTRTGQLTLPFADLPPRVPREAVQLELPLAEGEAPLPQQLELPFAAPATRTIQVGAPTPEPIRREVSRQFLHSYDLLNTFTHPVSEQVPSDVKIVDRVGKIPITEAEKGVLNKYADKFPGLVQPDTTYNMYLSWRAIGRTHKDALRRVLPGPESELYSEKTNRILRNMIKEAFRTRNIELNFRPSFIDKSLLVPRPDAPEKLTQKWLQLYQRVPESIAAYRAEREFQIRPEAVVTETGQMALFPELYDQGPGPRTSAPDTDVPEVTPEGQAVLPLDAPAPVTPSSEAAAPEPAVRGAVPETATPEAVAPEAVAPEAVAPEAVAPEAVAPEAVKQIEKPVMRERVEWPANVPASKANIKLYAQKISDENKTKAAKTRPVIDLPPDLVREYMRDMRIPAKDDLGERHFYIRVLYDALDDIVRELSKIRGLKRRISIGLYSDLLHHYEKLYRPMMEQVAEAERRARGTPPGEVSEPPITARPVEFPRAIAAEAAAPGTATPDAAAQEAARGTRETAMPPRPPVRLSYKDERGKVYEYEVPDEWLRHIEAHETDAVTLNMGASLPTPLPFRELYLRKLYHLDRQKGKDEGKAIYNAIRDLVYATFRRQGLENPKEFLGEYRKRYELELLQPTRGLTDADVPMVVNPDVQIMPDTPRDVRANPQIEVGRRIKLDAQIVRTYAGDVMHVADDIPRVVYEIAPENTYRQPLVGDMVLFVDAAGIGHKARVKAFTTEGITIQTDTGAEFTVPATFRLLSSGRLFNLSIPVTQNLVNELATTGMGRRVPPVPPFPRQEPEQLRLYHLGLPEPPQRGRQPTGAEAPQRGMPPSKPELPQPALPGIDEETRQPPPATPTASAPAEGETGQVLTEQRITGIFPEQNVDTKVRAQDFVSRIRNILIGGFDFGDRAIVVENVDELVQRIEKLDSPRRFFVKSINTTFDAMPTEQMTRWEKEILRLRNMEKRITEGPASSLVGRALYLASEPFTFIRAMTLGGDMSAMLIHGAFYVSREPFPKVRELFRTGVKTLFARNAAMEYLQNAHSLISDPLFVWARAAGVDFTGLDPRFIELAGRIAAGEDPSPFLDYFRHFAQKASLRQTKEEAFLNTFIEHVPLLKEYARRSEYSFTSMTNLIRMHTFKRLAEQYMAEHGIPHITAMPSQALQAIGMWTNITSGRANIPLTPQTAEFLASVFRAPRYMLSRWQLYNPLTYAKLYDLSPQIAREAMKDLAAFTLTRLALLGAARLAGFAVVTSPLASQWGAIRLTEDKAVNVWGGVLQPPTLVLSAMYGIKENIRGEKSRQRTRDIVMTYLRGQMSPAGQLFFDWAEGRDIAGRRFIPATEVPLIWEQSPLDVTLNSYTTPLFLQDLRDAIQDNWSRMGLFLSALSWVGLGVVEHKPIEGKKRKLRLTRDTRPKP